MLNKEKLSPYPPKPNNIVLNLQTKLNILDKVIETAAADGYDPDERKLIKSDVIKRIANLIIPNANTSAANGTVSKGWRKWLYNQTIGRCVGPKCKNTGGHRTRRAKSRRTRRS